MVYLKVLFTSFIAWWKCSPNGLNRYRLREDQNLQILTTNFANPCAFECYSYPECKYWIYWKGKENDNCWLVSGIQAFLKSRDKPKIWCNNAWIN